MWARKFRTQWHVSSPAKFFTVTLRTDRLHRDGTLSPKCKIITGCSRNSWWLKFAIGSHTLEFVPIGKFSVQLAFSQKFFKIFDAYFRKNDWHFERLFFALSPVILFPLSPSPVAIMYCRSERNLVKILWPRVSWRCLILFRESLRMTRLLKSLKFMYFSARWRQKSNKLIKIFSLVQKFWKNLVNLYNKYWNYFYLKNFEKC